MPILKKNKCPKCQKGSVPYFLNVCYACAFPKFNHIKWKDLKFGDKVYVAGNNSITGKLLPCPYGPHIVSDTLKKELLSGSNGKIFPNPEETLLMLK